MKHKFFAISARNPEADEAALNNFCSQNRVSFVEKQLVADGERSFWSVCVTYQVVADSHREPKASGRPKVDYKKILSEEDFDRYLELRVLRKEVAERQAVPAWAVFTNEQLATMIQQQVNNKAGLESIDNIGGKRIDLYGDEFLQRLNLFWAKALMEPADEAPKDSR